MWKMWTSAQVYEVTNFVYTCHTFVGNFLIDQVGFESIVTEKVQGFFLRKFKSLKAMLRLNNLLYQSFKRREVLTC